MAFDFAFQIWATLIYIIWTFQNFILKILDSEGVNLCKLKVATENVKSSIQKLSVRWTKV